ncbi:hypothetical protein [Bifidobacterium sp. ESL0820]|uniref:hypothetical protein n=1 Tax=Bifidobacterium sp. ESL0820 TaxID=3448586 RepID=UPI0040428F9F
MTDQQTVGIPSGKAPNDDTDDEHRQQLQWTLEQTQLRCDDLQGKHDKLMDLAARLLGLCAISGFTTFLSKSTWQDLIGAARFYLRWSVILLFVAVIAAVFVLIFFSVKSSLRDQRLLDITKLGQEQSTEEKTTCLIKTLSAQIERLRKSNFYASFAVYFMYAIYAISLELLVLIILSYH